MITLKIYFDMPDINIFSMQINFQSKKNIINKKHTTPTFSNSYGYQHILINTL